MYGRKEKLFKNETYQELNIKPTPNKNNRAVLTSKHQHFERVQGHERCLIASSKKTHLCSNIYFGSELKYVSKLAKHSCATAGIVLVR